jgi:hypothetical protein
VTPFRSRVHGKRSAVNWKVSAGPGSSEANPFFLVRAVAERGDDREVADADFIDRVADRLAGLPGVVAVSLGGSRAQGTQRADSDWDMAIYYRDSFNPQTLRDVGWSGEVSEIGGWEGGVQRWGVAAD